MQLEAFNKLIQAQLRGGRVREAHAFLEGNAGYFLYEGSDVQLAEDLAAWSSYAEFEIHEFIPVQKLWDISVKALKKRAKMA